MSNHAQQSAQKKSVSKADSNEDGRQRLRPSLFPFRNSARRRSSFCDDPDIFNPHVTDKDRQGSRSKTKSESGDEEQQKSIGSACNKSLNSTPRTPRSLPKQFQADTPFVPFTHQSLTRTVWQSQQIIPQQREEVERKQSQNALAAQLSKIKGSQNFDEDQNYSKLKSKISSKRNQKINYLLSHKDSHQHYRPSLHICNNLSISIQPESPNVLSIGGKIEHTEIPISIPVSECYQQTNKPSFNFASNSISISPRKRQMGYSDLVNVSVSPVFAQTCDQNQQTDKREVKVGRLLQISLEAPRKHTSEVQTVNKILSVGNRYHESAITSRRQNLHQQTESLHERLSHISRCFNEKIGKPKKYKTTQQQTFSLTNSKPVGSQTESDYNFRINSQNSMNMMISYDYQSALEKKIDQFEEILRNLAIKTEKQNDKAQTSQVGIQCDSKNLENKAALKRVSIAPTNLVYNLDQSESDTVKSVRKDEQKVKKDSPIPRKSKGKGQVAKLIEDDSCFDIDQEVRSNKNKKSKRKQGKTPNKKSKK